MDSYWGKEVKDREKNPKDFVVKGVTERNLWGGLKKRRNNERGGL